MEGVLSKFSQFLRWQYLICVGWLSWQTNQDLNTRFDLIIMKVLILLFIFPQQIRKKWFQKANDSGDFSIMIDEYIADRGDQISKFWTTGSKVEATEILKKGKIK